MVLFLFPSLTPFAKTCVQKDEAECNKMGGSRIIMIRICFSPFHSIP